MKYTNNYWIMTKVGEFGDYFWLIPVDIHPSQKSKDRPNKDIPLFAQLMNEGPLTFHKKDLQEYAG